MLLFILTRRSLPRCPTVSPRLPFPCAAKKSSINQSSWFRVCTATVLDAGVLGGSKACRTRLWPSAQNAGRLASVRIHCPPSAYVYTYATIYLYTNTRTHTYTHTHPHILYIYTYIHIHIHIFIIPPEVYTDTQTHRHTQIHIYIYILLG